MPRRIIVKTADGSLPVLVEKRADDEAQLQELVKDNPDLLPIEEFGLTGPVMTVGRETTLPSGAVDLVGLTRSGDLLIIEFKTGPENQDFRRALAQLLDYGSDIWQMPYEEFERTIAVRYFASTYCCDHRVRGKTSLEEAVKVTWPDMSQEEMAQLQERLSQQMASGSFNYVLVAQRFTETVRRTIDYLNAIESPMRFYALELVQFASDGLLAFESRTVLRPGRSPTGRSISLISEGQFLNGLTDDEYRDALREFFELCRGLGLRFEWGSAGTSIRLQTSDRTEPLTIAWLFPPKKLGWMGLRDLTLGFDPMSAERTPSARGALDRYSEAVGNLDGVEQVKSKFIRGYRLNPSVVICLQTQLAEIIAELVRQTNEQA